MVVFEIIPAAIDIDEDARQGCRQDRRPVFVQISVQFPHESVRKSIRKSRKPGLAVIRMGDVRQGMRAVMGNADQNRHAPVSSGVFDDRKSMFH